LNKPLRDQIIKLVPKSIKVEKLYRPMAEWFRNLDCKTYQN